MTAHLRLSIQMSILGGLVLCLGVLTGSDGTSLADMWALWHEDAALLWRLVWEIRAPRTLGAALVGALLGVCGGIAQGVFRNPLADPYLLGTSAGAGLGVVLVLALGSAGWMMPESGPGLAWLARFGVLGAAFIGAIMGVALTLIFAGGALDTNRLLLSGILVGIVLGAFSDLLTVVSPDALRGKQAFLLGNTSDLGWASVLTLVFGLAVVLWGAQTYARALDALTLGDRSAESLGLDLRHCRSVLIALLCLGTALAVSQAGLIAFVGLVAPHLLRRQVSGPHRWLLFGSAGMGALLLMTADWLSRALLAPNELPVGVLTAVLGGLYLFVLMRQRRGQPL